MKNILFFRISLALVGLLCSGGQANDIFPISDEVKNKPNWTALLDEIDSESAFFDLFTELGELLKAMDKLFERLGLTELNTDTDRTKLPENINVTIKYKNVTESHTQPNIYCSMISNSTPINYRLINNNTKQNNDTYVNKFHNSTCISSTYPEYSTIRNSSNRIPRSVFIFSAYTWNICFMIKKQYNKIVKKLHTVYITLLPRPFIASIVPGIRKYWLLRGISEDTITGYVVLYVSLVVFCGMLLFVAFITIKTIRRLWNSRRKLKPQKEHLLYFVL